MRRALSLSLAAIAALTAVLVAGLLWWKPASRPHSPEHHAPASQVAVTAKGTGLLLAGAPWWPTGFNAYQLTTDWSLNTGCGAEVDLDAYFSALPPDSLTRFSLFAPITIRTDDGTIDYAAADAVFAAAARHHQWVLPVLAAGDGACDGEVFKTADWYTAGWRTAEATAHGTYLDWVRAAVGRWKNQPALAGWTAVGEAEPSTCDAEDCADWSARRCPPDAAALLRTFFDEVGAEIATEDPGRLRFAGLVGAGQCGTAGRAFVDVGGSPGVDVLEYHDYTVDEPVPPEVSVAARMVSARELNKPLVVAEIGVLAGSCQPLTVRADQIRAVIAQQRAIGTAGALPWAYVPDPRPDQCTFDIGPGDPLWPSVLLPG